MHVYVCTWACVLKPNPSYVHVCTRVSSCGGGGGCVEVKCLVITNVMGTFIGMPELGFRV